LTTEASEGETMDGQISENTTDLSPEELNAFYRSVRV
jgi:hypothetical protein